MEVQRWLHMCAVACVGLWNDAKRFAGRLWTALSWIAGVSGIKWLFSEIPIIAFLLSVLAVSVLFALVLKWVKPETVLVVSAFEVPANNATVGISGRTVSNILVDEMGGLTVEANRYLAATMSASVNDTASMQETLHLSTGQLEKPTIDVEVEGISLKGMTLEWDKLRQTQIVVTGDLYWEPSGAVLRARIDPDWRKEWGPIKMTLSDLTRVCREAALEILSEWEPKIGGVIYQSRGDLNRSISLYQRWVTKARSNSEKAQAYFQLGVAFDMKGDLDNALQNYTHAINLSPTLPEAFANRGVVRQQQKELNEAILDFQTALNLFKKDDFITLVNLGNAWDDNRQYEKAIDCYQRALRLFPRSPYVHYNLSVSLRKGGRTREADQELREFESLKKDMEQKAKSG